MNSSDLIQPRHHARRALVYVRQSSPQQALSNQESLRLQYALKQRALELGWHEGAIEVIDTDLGHTAATTEGRLGFQHLVAQVALGEVSILIAYDATRLARNCSHWYQLLDLCGRAGCLIADRDGVYDPASINGRLLLGLKGQISELELHTLRARLTAGLVSKAQRGDLAQKLPTGLVRLPSDQVVKHPDRSVQARISLIFQTLLDKRSVRQAVLYLQQHHLTVPRQDEAGQIQWKRATMANVRRMVTNPAYAGAFAYGRTGASPGEKTGTRRLLPPEQWKICVRDKYPAYIAWEIYEKILAMLQDNYSEYQRRRNRGVPRQGNALLQGLLYCGECGHKLAVQYKHGARYVCNQLRRAQGEPTCQYLPAAPLDAQVVRWFGEALSVAEIDLSIQALAQADQQRAQRLAARRHEVERLRHQSRLAERQYQQTEPENRLVAAELERRWEAALRALQEAEDRLHKEERSAPCWALPADLIAALKDVGPHLPALWEQGLFDPARKKALLRTLIDKVVVQRVAGDMVRTRVVWRGGATTSADVTIPVSSLAQRSGAQAMQEAILRLAREGQSDSAIAHRLTAQGYRSPLREELLPSTVAAIRRRHGLRRRARSRRWHVPGHLTITELAEKLGVSRYWIHDRIQAGTIPATRDAKSNCYIVPDKADVLRQITQLLER
jgi:DNA invertase Pin-like site-specific DNA recombinase